MLHTYAHTELQQPCAEGDATYRAIGKFSEIHRGLRLFWRVIKGATQARAMHQASYSWLSLKTGATP